MFTFQGNQQADDGSHFRVRITEKDRLPDRHRHDFQGRNAVMRGRVSLCIGRLAAV